MFDREAAPIFSATFWLKYNLKHWRRSVFPAHTLSVQRTSLYVLGNMSLEGPFDLMCRNRGVPDDFVKLLAANCVCSAEDFALMATSEAEVKMTSFPLPRRQAWSSPMLSTRLL